tara:strand:- start:335 stop:1150 length:816 start_codon:yes stop_codon:yes gene_type:complete
MAETLTYDPGTDTVTTGENLTSEEQESLAVGEELQNQQEGLLAGKYENAQALEKAYIELQKKLGEDGQEKAPQAETEQEEVLPEESKEESQELSPAAELITTASDEFAKSGELTSETIEQFSSLSSRELVEAYMQVQADLPQQTSQQAEDISDAAVNQVKNAAGGEQAYQQMVDWASNNLDQSVISAFDEIINTGSIPAINMAVSGLRAQYENAVGYEGRMLSGKAPTTSKDVFRSQAELVAAMADKRYDKDPAYRQDIMEKLARSDNVQF